MNAWSDLPNTHHIDWVLKSLRDNPKLWGAAWYAAWDAVRGAAMNAAMNAARGAARDAARNAAWVAARDAAWGAARDAIMALVAYDDCEEYLSMTYEQLRAWALLSETPQAVLLLPLKWVQEQQIGSAECVPNTLASC